ncbi:MAG: NusG domain II-containing protein [Spirochaetaceae bacterium]|nr:NusG domain II-containing protein [Spirochaetaceae bacterium]
MKKNKSIFNTFYFLDFIIIIIASLICVFSVIFIFTNKTGQPILHITSDTTEYLYTLNENKQIAIEGLLGTSIIEIKNSKVCFTDSPCTNKTCIASGSIKSNNQWIACLPNGIFIRIEADSSNSDIDIISF